MDRFAIKQLESN